MKNKTKMTFLISAMLIMTMVFALVGCGSSEPATGNEVEAQVETPAETAPEAAPAETATEATTEAAEAPVEEVKESSATLPAYEYPGPEAFYYELYKYMVDELGSKFSDYEVCIPNPLIVDIDDSDKADIKVYGDFWVDNYNLEGDTLMSVSGGSFPGVIHMKFDETGYKITGMDVVADGSDYMESAKELFGDRYEAFAAVTADQDAREANRAQIVANYVAANGLNITQYQDYGWDPVTLPEENIDTFYSDL